MNSQPNQLYMAPREDGEIDLIAEVRKALCESGLAQQVTAWYDTNESIQAATTKKAEVQRYLLNRFWNVQLLSTKATSFDERYCLVPNGDTQDWLRLFKEKVLPFAVAHSLPRAL